MKRINICLSTDDNYAKYAAAAMLSAVENMAFDDEIVFHILYSKLQDENIEKLSKIANVEFHQIDNEIFAPFFNNGVCKNVTIPTLYRLKLPSLLPDIERIIYLDCDLIVLKSLGEFYDTELSDNQYAACVPDLGSGIHMARMKFEQNGINFYFNAGVCLLDLNKMRKYDIEYKMFDYLCNYWENLSYSDQDVMNAVLLGHVKEMERKYNFITPNFYFSNDKDVTIAHFAGVKPWKIGFYNKYREMFWHYLLKTGFLDKKRGAAQKNKIFFMHKRFCQILWHIKMYPCFFLKENRREDFMRIVKNRDY